MALSRLFQKTGRGKGPVPDKKLGGIAPTKNPLVTGVLPSKGKSSGKPLFGSMKKK